MSNFKNIKNIFFSELIGFIVFLVLLALLNTLTNFIQNPIFLSIVDFLNSNLVLIILFTIIFFIAEIFGILHFPFNLPQPLLSAFGAILIIRFIFEIFDYIQIVVGITINFPFTEIYTIIAIIVFVVVIMVGYVRIFSGVAKRKKHKVASKGKK